MQPHVETLIGLALCVLGCGSDASYRPGATDVPRPVSSPGEQPAPASSARWELFGQLSAMQAHGPEFVSRGHGTGDWNARVRLNRVAADALPQLGPATSMPKGSVLVQLHTEKRSGAPVEAFVMEKRDPGYFPAGGDWDYAVVGIDGMIQQRGRLAFCARCHAEAPAGFVFTRRSPAP